MLTLTPTSHANAAVVNAQAILDTWVPFKNAIGVTSVHSPAQYAQAQKTIDALLAQVGDDESHPLADVLDYLADQVKAYEHEHFHIAASAPHEVLRFLLEQHGLAQVDLADCAPQSRISDILSQRRGISKQLAKRLAARFNVPVALFFD